MTDLRNDHVIPTKWLKNVNDNLLLFHAQAGKTYGQDAEALIWINFAIVLTRNALIGYAAGEMTFQETLRVVDTMSKLCPPSARLMLMGIAADRALNTKPKRLGEQKPLIPRWLRASFGQMIHQGMTEEGLTQIQAAQGVLELIDRWGFAALLKKNPTVETLQDWHRDWKRGQGIPLKTGRPSSPRKPP
jgi:hypothetical protein